jgi:hypothetical protein
MLAERWLPSIPPYSIIPPDRVAAQGIINGSILELEIKDIITSAELLEY